MNHSSCTEWGLFNEGLKAARRACIAEHLNDPQDEADRAYDLAIRHCVAAIERLMKHQVEKTDTDFQPKVQP